MNKNNSKPKLDVLSYYDPRKSEQDFELYHGGLYYIRPCKYISHGKRITKKNRCP